MSAQRLFYFSDDGDLTGLRYDNWKFVFAEQRARERSGLGGAVCPAARAENLQPARGPL